VLALGIAGAALDYSADAGNAEDVGSTPTAVETSRTSPAAAWLWKDDIRWAQLELRNMGLYAGSLDGIVGPETKQALDQFQRNKGLKQTATLDPRTLDALIVTSAMATDPASRRTLKAPNLWRIGLVRPVWATKA